MRFLFFWFCGGALLPFVLRVVAGACVGRWTGQPRMPPRERLHEGLGGGLFHMLRRDGTPPCGGAGEGGMLLTTGVVMRRRATTGVDGTRVKALWVCFTLRAAARERGVI